MNNQRIISIRPLPLIFVVDFPTYPHEAHIFTLVILLITTDNSWGKQTKSPPQVEPEDSHISFPIRPVKRPYDGFFMLNWTLLPCPGTGFRQHKLFNCL